MKKYLILLLILLNTVNVNAKEEIIPIRKGKKLIGVKDIITIESNQQTIMINSIAVKGLLSYTSLNTKDKYKIKIIIKNNDYKYIKNTLKYKKYKYEEKYTIYRTINTPLKKLYKDKKIDLNDAVLDKKLREKGYKGIEELHKYYADYYKCDKLTSKELKKIIKGKKTNIKENNYKINELAYHYFYKNIFKITNNNLNLEIYLNKRYMTDAFENYPYDMKVLFYLKKNH